MPVDLVCVLGETAAGKSALAFALAQQRNGEIISADAMAVYRGMDIGTAKPSPDERAAVPHHLLDCCEVDQRSDAASWLAAAEQAITDITKRGGLPIVAGGTPLYVSLLLNGMSAGPPREPAVRADLERRYETLGGAAMLAELAAVDPAYAASRHANDRRRIVRALEVHILTGRPYSAHHVDGNQLRAQRYRSLLIGLRWPPTQLAQRISDRVEQMFAAGLVEELRDLRPRLGPEAAQAVGYKELLALLDGQIDRDEAQRRVVVATRRLARRQRTWWRRFPDIHWLAAEEPELTARALALVDAGAAPRANLRHS